VVLWQTQIMLSEQEECLAKEIVDCGLDSRGNLIFLSPMIILFSKGLRLDVLVEDLIICELKAADLVNPVWQAQLISHLKLTNKRLGFLINFNVSKIKKALKELLFN
jgi:GxxExxY protein